MEFGAEDLTEQRPPRDHLSEGSNPLDLLGPPLQSLVQLLDQLFQSGLPQFVPQDMGKAVPAQCSHFGERLIGHRRRNDFPEELKYSRLGGEPREAANTGGAFVHDEKKTGGPPRAVILLASTQASIACLSDIIAHAPFN